MYKRYVVRLTDEERGQLEALVCHGRAHARKLLYGRILLKADANGEGWTDERIAEALKVSAATVARERRRFCEEGLEAALMPRKPGRARRRVLDRRAEARLVALTSSEPPEGRGGWSLRLLADRMVELGHVKGVSHETVRSTFLPDLDAKNSFVANYLIQHAIWTTEEFGIDGWRVDTYFYNDLDFMNRCNRALYNEFPRITIFGETWIHSVTNQAYFTENNLIVPWKSNLQGVTDFQWYFSLNAALNENFDFTGGVSKLYNVLAQDILYKDPMRNVIFLDNHDLDRYYSVVGEDIRKFKMGIALLLTQRGIPQLYYGTEILMKNFKNPSDAEVRRDFPGGFPGDGVNKFLAAGRTEQENDAFNYVKRFANFRKNSSALKTGKLMQYLPEDGVYVYFRYDNAETVMCVFNQNDASRTINLSRFTERIKDNKRALDVATGTSFNLEPTLTLGGKYVLVMKLSR